MPGKTIVGILVMVAIGVGVWYFYSHVAPTPIGKILETPRDYEGKVITIKGKVTHRASLVVIKYFSIKDSTGEIKVITDQFLPTVGSEIRVRGRVKEAFLIGGSPMLVFVEEDRGKEKP